MRKLMKVLLFGVIAGPLATGPVLARCGGGCWHARGGGGWGPESNYGRVYSAQSVETVSGEVVSVDEMTPGRGMHRGLHAVVKTDKETIPVHLGPVWYLENQEIHIQPKDKVEIKGSRVTYEGKPAIIAAEVRKGDDVLQLRDEGGFPRWGGWRRRS